MRLRVVGTAASLLAVAPGVSFALGFGEIQLRSTLNAPLNAEIDLIATTEELASLRTQLASRDAFSRAGLDYPAFLSSIQVRVERRADGRAFLRLTSTAPMTEPFATILVEASDSTGSRFREFTMLFDPPTFAPAPVAATPPPAQVAAPITGAGDRSANIPRPAAPAAPAATAPTAPVSRPAPVAGGDQYTVRGGDSLSAIARRQYGTGEADRAMIAIYRGNQHAFDSNINRLRAGTVLRLPDNATVNAVNPAEATAEVRRQSASWRSETGVATTTPADPRLVLIPPASPGAAGGTSAQAKALSDENAALRAELAEKNRLIELQVQQLAARVQAPPATTPAPVTPAPAEPPVAVTPAPAPAPVVTPPTPVEPAKPAQTPAAEEAGTPLVDILKRYWMVLAGLLVAVLVAALGMRAARRRREAPVDNLTPFDIPAVAPVRDTSSDTFPLRKPLSDADERSILVEESGTHERPALVRRDTRTVDLEDSSTSMSVPALDATAALEQGDPLAEADFHMAYGLYDQAADLVKLAIMREPRRRDLKLKLLEVFFVWGNKDQFLQTARDLADTRDAAGPGEWEKVVIMGKQLAPEDALFSQTYSGRGPASIDLNLEGGQNLVDFDLHGEPSVSLTRDGGIDLGGGASRSDASGSFSGLDFVLDDPARGNTLERTATTRQMAQPDAAGSDAGVTRRMETDGPTVEQPALDSSVDTLIGKIDAHAGFMGSDQTAELAIDDLGLDLGKFDATGTNATLLDDSQLARALEAADSPTLVAGLDDTSRTFIEGGGEADQPTELLPMGDFGELDDAAATARVSMLDLEFDLDSTAETGKRKAIREGDAGIDLDVGAPDQTINDEFQRTQPVKAMSDADATERDLEPVTMSEVGTKLDLARAYMDMGDPDGARSILREVLQEGSANQRQEAQRLIDSIPG